MTEYNCTGINGALQGYRVSRGTAAQCVTLVDQVRDPSSAPIPSAKEH